MERHPLLPSATTEAFEMKAWLIANSVEHYVDTVKRYYTEDEKNEFAHESSHHGREINRIKAILKHVTDCIQKGNDEVEDIEIPATVGIKTLEKQRFQNDENLERGFESEEVTVYGILNREEEIMEYFTEEGIHIAERTRELTAKEKFKLASGATTLSMASGM